MKRDKAVVDARRDLIFAELTNNQNITVQELSQKFQVSALTIRRDYQHLCDQGKITRFYGGAAVNEDYDPEIAIEQTDKNVIAQYAAGLIEEGDTVFINTSSTAIQILKYLKDKHVTVITNNGNAFNMDVDDKVTVVFIGGELQKGKNSMVGDFAANNLSRISAKKSFLGCSGMSIESGMTTEALSEVHINEMMLQRTVGAAYILADHLKMGKNSSYVSCHLHDIENIITCEQTPESLVEKFRNRGIEVYRARKRG